MKAKVLVAGADQHQGLAIIQALGVQGYPVIACGAETSSLGYYSRYAVEHYTYNSPILNKPQFVVDILDIIRRTKPAVVIPGVESALIGLNECRNEFEPGVILAAPSSEVLAFALDKSKTLEIATQLGVPSPATVQGRTLEELMANAMTLRFPVAVKPQGHRVYAATPHHANFKVRYARTVAELQQILTGIAADLSHILVQECLPGIGVCVGVIADHGIPLAMLAYRRVRELPLTGGVSVVRETVELNKRLRQYVTALLNAIKWHGVAMVEFKYIPATQQYYLMEINGRFQASTALILDAGLNFPSFLVRLYLDGKIEGPTTYRVGIRERWLRGDLEALYGYLIGAEMEPTRRNPLSHVPPKSSVLREFLGDFRSDTSYDEFKLHDLKPAAIEVWAIARLVKGWVKAAGVSVLRRAALRLLRRVSKKVTQLQKPPATADLVRSPQSTILPELEPAKPI